MSLISFSNSSTLADSFQNTQHVTSKKNIESDSSPILLEEVNNESELEFSFEQQNFLIYYLIQTLKISAANFLIPNLPFITEKVTNPIYLSVCNFRI